jgi:murein DD-endopeptidase MepM/ murein hydrolase activator NlpD
MIPRKAVLVLAAVALLGACARNAPPAPLSMPGERPSKSPPPALVPQTHLPHPDQVVVGQGDTIYTISRRYDVPERSIIDANHLQPPYRIAAGTTLALPQERFHVVQPGDTLYGVSRLYGVEVSTLASLNHLDAPYALKVGQTLYLPASVEPVDKAAPALPPARPDAAPATAPPPPGPPGAKPPDQQAGAPASPQPPPGEKPPEPKAATAAAAPAPTSPPEHRAGKESFVWPVQGRVIGRYGTGPGGTHNDGINIAATPGEPVHAAGDGVVAYAGNELRGYGNLVLIKHPGGYMTAYAHNSSLLVKRGEIVKRGQEIARAGSTGTVSTPQVHFEIRQGTRALDPTGYLPGSG